MSRLFGWALIALATVGCGEKPFRKQVAAVTGKIQVDGKEPGSSIKVVCHSQHASDAEHPTFSQGFSDDQGNFKISTYETGDGVPEGEYVLTFEWGKMNVLSASYGGPDKLKGRYAKPDKSEIKITAAGEPIDLGTIELKTKD